MPRCRSCTAGPSGRRFHFTAPVMTRPSASSQAMSISICPPGPSLPSVPIRPQAASRACAAGADSLLRRCARRSRPYAYPGTGRCAPARRPTGRNARGPLGRAPQSDSENETPGPQGGSGTAYKRRRYPEAGQPRSPASTDGGGTPSAGSSRQSSRVPASTTCAPWAAGRTTTPSSSATSSPIRRPAPGAGEPRHPPERLTTWNARARPRAASAGGPRP